MMSKEVAERMLAFQSDPSLPALLSSTSSVSADLEGEFLGNPGVVGQRAPSAVDAEGDTTDSLTPPAPLGKESVAGFPLDVLEGGVVPVRLDGRARAGTGESAAHHHTGVATRRASHGNYGHQHQRLHLQQQQRRRAEEEDDGDSDSDSDEGLTMARRKKVPASVAASVVASPSREMLAPPGDGEKVGRVTVGGRRGTNASVGSTETAKKVFAVGAAEEGGEVKAEGVVVDSE